MHPFRILCSSLGCVGLAATFFAVACGDSAAPNSESPLDGGTAAEASSSNGLGEDAAGADGGASSADAAQSADASDGVEKDFGKLDAKGKLTVPESRWYMLGLINQNRATKSLPPVELEEGPGQTEAQAHAEEMALNGYGGHWSLDGRLPTQRYSEAGGQDHNAENVSGYTDGKPRVIDPNELITTTALKDVESAFFNEVPPNDGHRVNILDPARNKVALGIAKGKGADLLNPDVVQEFINAYGTYEPLPATAKVGSKLHIEGVLSAPASFYAMDLGRLDSPKPMTVAQLNATEGYSDPDAYVTYFDSDGVIVDGAHFTFDAPMSNGSNVGVYFITIWANIPPLADPQVVSMRTVLGTK
jgi:uncharacterized protein YkwD